jgi:2'-5' RNA ligase
VTPVTQKPEGWERPYLPGALIIVPPADIRHRVNRLRRRYDPRSADTVGPHLTVAQPFRCDPDPAELARVRKVLVGFEPFTVTFGPLKNFLPYPCIWFDIQPAERVLAMRRALHSTGLFNTDLEYTEGFVPHMSITDGTPDAEETALIFNRIRNRVRGGRFRVDHLVYSRPDWRMKFHTVERLPLGR